MYYLHGQIHYSSYGIKKGNWKAKQKLPVSRRLPKLVSRYCLIFLLALERHQFMPTRVLKPRWAAKHIFGLHEEPTMLDLRHLWTDILNIILGISTKTPNLSVAAFQCGHTTRVHSDRYVTDIATSEQFELFHQGIGDELPLSAAEAQITIEDCFSALQKIYGKQAEFFSGQKELITAFLDGGNIHGTLPCGAGKSMMWLLPAIAAENCGVHFGSIFVVLPYLFLVDHFLQQAKDMDILAAGLKKTDIPDRGKPTKLSDERLPPIVYMTPDALNVLKQNCLGFLQEWVKKKQIRAIILDEIQTIFFEIHFRHAYNVFPTLVKHLPGLQVVTLSGTFPTEMEDVLKTYLGTKPCRTVKKDGIGLDGIYLCVVDAPINLQSIADHCLKRTQIGAVHVICATKEFCSQLSDQIQALNKNKLHVRVVSSDTHEEERSKSCQEWSNGNCIILVSTTCCLVGNENKKCKSIVGVGHLFNVACLIQACGRLRPCQRDETCEARFFVNTRQPVPIPEDSRSVFGDHSIVTSFSDPNKLTEFYKERHKCRQIHLSQLLGSEPDHSE